MSKNMRKAKRSLERKVERMRERNGVCPLQVIRYDETGEPYPSCMCPDLLVNCEYRGDPMKNPSLQLYDYKCDYTIRVGK